MRLKVSPGDDSHEGHQWVNNPTIQTKKKHPSHLPPQAKVMTAGLRQSAISLLVKSFPWNSSKPHFYLTTLLVFSRFLSFLLIAGAMPRLVFLREIKRNPVIFSTCNIHLPFTCRPHPLLTTHLHFSPPLPPKRGSGRGSSPEQGPPLVGRPSSNGSDVSRLWSLKTLWEQLSITVQMHNLPRTQKQLPQRNSSMSHISLLAE